MEENSEKMYRIGEAAELLGVKPYVLRFWESEFPQISPYRTAKGQRHYSEADIELLRRIKYLLYEQRLTIDGARKLLSGKVPIDPKIEQGIDAYGAKSVDGALSKDADMAASLGEREALRGILGEVHDELLRLRHLLAKETEDAL